MNAKEAITAGCIIASMLFSEAARAENAIYQGSCDRAQAVATANSVDKVIKHNAYKSVALLKLNGEYEKKCPSETMIYRDLTLISRTSSEVVFDLTQITVKIGKENNSKDCGRLHLWDKSGYGTIKFRLEVSKIDETCEVFLHGDWHIKSTNSATYSAKFGGRVLVLNDGNFVMAQPTPQQGSIFAPITFMGI